MEKGNEAMAGGPSVQHTGSGAGVATAGAENGGTATAPGSGTGTGPESAPTGEGAAGHQADQSGPAESKHWMDDLTDDELRDHADAYDVSVAHNERQIQETIANHPTDSQAIDHFRDMVDRGRYQSQQARQKLHERELARSTQAGPADAGGTPQGPSGHMTNPDGSRVGVDEQGRGYSADPSGRQAERPRHDQFGPPGSASSSD